MMEALEQWIGQIEAEWATRWIDERDPPRRFAPNLEGEPPCAVSQTRGRLQVTEFVPVNIPAPEQRLEDRSKQFRSLFSKLPP